jgi:segregation and condensation protein B
MLTLSAKIEAILFFRGEPTTVKKLSTTLSSKPEEIRVALDELGKNLEGRGICLVQSDDEIMLGTSREASEIIEAITREELSRDLGKAGLETLTIILYKHPVSKREIDYIRGVNSGFIIRNLLIRGLVERTGSKEGERSYFYKPTLELLSFMGLKETRELPEYENVLSELNEFEDNMKKEETSSQAN